MILLSWQIPLEIHQSGHAMGGNGGLQIFCPKCLWTFENFPFHFFKTLGWFFLVAIPSIVQKVNPLTR